jgi:hypothetical protein
MPIPKRHQKASAKQSMAGPSAKTAPLKPRRGILERAATALGSGTRSEDADVRNLATADRLSAKLDATESLAAAVQENRTKGTEYAHDGELPTPAKGVAIRPDNLDATASTITESNESRKNGEKATPSLNANITPLHNHRVDSLGRALTTNQGVPIADNQNSLRAGLRGPTLLEDFILREKITHFDHERIPERVVHARGSGAHGYFECTEDITALTKAAPFRAIGKRTPVFVRFSTVAGERGSADTVRDVRGFAVKFYTEEGNWDLVGNNIPVFFIQDAMKFPDVVHAVKPEPHHQMPQASSAHDTFYDALLMAGAVPRWVGARLGTVETASGDELSVEVTMEAAPSVLFDAVVLPAGERAAAALAADELAVELVMLQFRHKKPLLVPRSSMPLLAAATRTAQGAEDAGLLFAADDELRRMTDPFVRAIARHRVWRRQLGEPELRPEATVPRARPARVGAAPPPLSGGAPLRGRGRSPARRPIR